MLNPSLQAEHGPNLRPPHSRALGAGPFELRPHGRSDIGRAFYCLSCSQSASAPRSCCMAEIKYAPVKHDHQAFLSKARARKGFSEAYDALELEYRVANQPSRGKSAGRSHVGTTKSAISRLEPAGKHTPSLATLQRYARAVGCDLQIKLVPR